MKQNVPDGRTDAQHEIVYPLQTKFAGGIKTKFAGGIKTKFSVNNQVPTRQY